MVLLRRAAVIALLSTSWFGRSAWSAPPAGPESIWVAQAVPRQAAVPEVPKGPEGRSKHGRSSRNRYLPRLPRPTPGRPAITPAPLESWAALRPAAVGHPSRPVVTPLPNLNVVADPRVSVYFPGRPVAHPHPGLSIVSPHYVVGRLRPEHRWLGAGRLRTARRVAPLR